MHYSTGLLGERAALLLATMLLLHSVNVTSAVSLSMDEPQFLVGGVAIVESAKYPLLDIVRCSNAHLDVSINEVYITGNESLQVRLEENSNKPNEVFVLPSNTDTVHSFRRVPI